MADSPVGPDVTAHQSYSCHHNTPLYTCHYFLLVHICLLYAFFWSLHFQLLLCFRYVSHKEHFYLFSMQFETLCMRRCVSFICIMYQSAFKWRNRTSRRCILGNLLQGMRSNNYWGWFGKSEIVEQAVREGRLELSGVDWSCYPQTEFPLLQGSLSSAFKTFQLIKSDPHRLSRIISFT